MTWLLMLLAALNGFSLEKLVVPRDSILAGGPPRDGIRSVDSPEFVPAAEAGWVKGTTPVIGVVLKGEARAYPTHLLEYHQVVNDLLGEVPVTDVRHDLTVDEVACELAQRCLLFGEGEIHAGDDT